MVIANEGDESVPFVGWDPEVLARIRSRKYECFIEDHEPKPWTAGQCAGYAGRGVHLMRCSKGTGHGYGGLFCRHHDAHPRDLNPDLGYDDPMPAYERPPHRWDAASKYDRVEERERRREEERQRAGAHDPGGRSTFAIPAGVHGDACLAGANGEHRLWLERRRIEGAGKDSPFVLWLCMNPSTAGAREDDPLARRVQELTWRMGLHRLLLLNAGTYRCTDPSLLPSDAELTHPDALTVLRACLASPLCARVVAATGKPPAVLTGAALTALGVLRASPRRIECLGTTADGWPRHPGRIAYATPLETLNVGALLN